MYTSGSESYANKDMLFARVDEFGVLLFTITEGILDIVQAPWTLWDAILPHVQKQREEIEAEIAAGREVPRYTLPTPTDISLKDFPK
jgi:hypothetical protein